MLPLAVIEEIRRLLAEGQLSQRKIAARLGVSRATVGSIASGRRGIYGNEPKSDPQVFSAYDNPPERCAGCGARVYKPCLLCQTRAYKRRQRPFILMQCSSAHPRGRRVA